MCSAALGGEVWVSTAGTSATSKTFVIDHPIYKDKYLIHSCVEGPETELIYRGKGVISTNNSALINLPDYAPLIGFNWSIHLTPVGKKFNGLSCSELDPSVGSFEVYGNNGEFYWIVYGQRTKFNVEPLKNSVNVKGDGPYRYI